MCFLLALCKFAYKYPSLEHRVTHVYIICIKIFLQCFAMLTLYGAVCHNTISLSPKLTLGS